MRSLVRPLLACCLVAVALPSCERATKPVEGTGVPALLLIQEGQDQSGVVGKELNSPLRVKVVDELGLPVVGQIVNFRVTSGGGSVFAGASITTENGLAVERWTLGTSIADSQRVEARAIDPNTGQRLVFGIFRATPLADAPHTIEKVAGDGQTGEAGAGLTDSMAVKVTDQYGNAVGGAQVQWAVGEGGGSVSPASGVTDANGIARARRTLNTIAGPHTASATVSSLSVSFSSTATAGAASQLIIETPASGAAAGAVFAVQPAVRVADAHGNTVTSATASVTLSVSGGAPLIGTPTRSPVNGIVTFNDVGIDAPAGSYTLTFSAALSAPATITQPLTVAEGAATKYVVTSSSASVVVANAVTLTAQLADAGNRPVSTAGRVVTWSKTGEGGAFSSATSTTNASGVATVTFMAGTAAPVTYTLVATDNSSLTGSASVATIADQPVKLAFVTQPSSTGRLINVSPAVQVAVQDQYGNTVLTSAATVSITIASNPGGATLTGASTASAVSGVATFRTLRLDRVAQGYTLRAQSDALSAVTSTAFDVVLTGVVVTSARTIRVLAIKDSSIFFRESWLYPLQQPPGECSGPFKRVSIYGGDEKVLYHNCGSDETLALEIEDDELHSIGWCCYLGHFIDRSTVSKIPIGGGTPSTIWHMDHPMPYLVVDAHRYYLSRSTGIDSRQAELFTIDRTTGQKTSLRLDIAPKAFTVDQGFVYFAYGCSSPPFDHVPCSDLSLPPSTTGSNIDKVPTTGGSVEPLAFVPGDITGFRIPGRLLVVGSRLYFLSSTGTGTATETTALESIPIAGGPRTTHVSGLRPSRLLKSDGTALYLNEAGSLQRYELNTFSRTTIVNSEALDFIVDSENIYWISNANGVYSIKKIVK